MSSSKLPERPSLEYLKKLARERLHELRQSDPDAKLAAALLAVARDYGFPSWRGLKAEVEKRQTDDVLLFFDACRNGDIATLERLLVNRPDLVRAEHSRAHHSGWTGLHEAAKRGQADVVNLLIRHGADVNAREEGDHTYPLHWAAAHGHLPVVRALVDAGADVHGRGDVHELDVIGWATFYREPGDDVSTFQRSRLELVSLLVERGARHHIFSAMSVGDLDLIRDVVEQDPGALDRRMSRFEHKQTPLHFAINRKRYDILDLLIELGADLEAPDQSGQSALSVAMLRGDREAMSRLHAAGATPPKPIPASSFKAGISKLADSVLKGVVPMMEVPDIARTLDWYTSIGFKEVGRYGDDGVVWGMVSFGKAQLAFNIGGKAGDHDVSMWFEIDRIDDLYQLFKAKQLEAAEATLSGEPGPERGIRFEEDLYEPFYGGRQFSIRDLNGYTLVFLQPEGA